MNVLGIEGTAHTISVGIINEEKILSNQGSMYHSSTGGIHPREAANHHFENVVPLIRSTLEVSGIRGSDIDLIAYSEGPGLGPCLKIAATAARSLSVKFNRPIIGVNHPLGHVEIGRRFTGVEDPAVLYLSGGNTQIIAHSNGRYRIFGETTDIGIGNMLDKFAREIGIGFPGGPAIEKLALEGKELYELPYSVKGMDSSFSGILTAATRLISKGKKKEDISYSIQETAFSMMIEILERALKHLGKHEILLTGGVARNQRLRDMVQKLGAELGMKTGLTPKEYCSDNGAMIAHAGMLMYKSGVRTPIEESFVNQNSRIDQVPVNWVRSENLQDYRAYGAEARIERSEFYERPALAKIRERKSYRNSGIDSMLRTLRTKTEISNLMRMYDLKVNIPVVYDFDLENSIIKMQYISGTTLSTLLRDRSFHDLTVISDLARQVAQIHNEGMSHGDLTTSNIMVDDSNRVILIDPSMGRASASLEDKAGDIFLLLESFRSAHSDRPKLGEEFLDQYRCFSSDYDEIRKRLDEIERRRRYLW
jgi:N6-L-threonylcarbamoyladenine synthase/protein kinase Bud32